MINKKKTPRLAASGSVLRRPSIESMESRRLLSASATSMAGRSWDFAPAQNPPMLFARPGLSHDVSPGAASPDFLRPSSDGALQPNRFESPSSNSFDGRADSNDWQGSRQFTNFGFAPAGWQGGPSLIIDVPTAMPQFGGATEVVYTISISGPYFSGGSFQETTLMTTSFQGNPAGMFDSSGIVPGGSYHDGRADRAVMPDPDQYTQPSTSPVYLAPPPNISTAAGAGNAASSPAAHGNLLRADAHPQTPASSQANSAPIAPTVVSSDHSSHGNISPIPAVSAVSSASGVASRAASIASIMPRVMMQESAAMIQATDEVVRVVGGTLATTGASAATTIVPQVVNGAQAMAAAAPVVVQETAAVAQAVIHINPIDAVATFSDSLAAFARDCAGIGTAKVDAPNSHRAWAITGAVLAADAILIGQWYARRSRDQQESEDEQKATATSAKRVQPMLAELPLVK